MYVLIHICLYALDWFLVLFCVYVLVPFYINAKQCFAFKYCIQGPLMLICSIFEVIRSVFEVICSVSELIIECFPS